MAKSVLCVFVLCFLGGGVFQNDENEEFVVPEAPLSEKEAPSPNVTNGHVFESGILELPELSEEQQLFLPANAVVEEYDGSEIRFFVTKSMHCVGHPPSEMRIADARKYFGVAYRMDGEDCEISTFGEWSNRGGLANLGILILVPQGQSYKKIEGLTGSKSKASTAMDFRDAALEDCYWYSGTKPADGWTLIETKLHYNRFLQPK